MVPPVEARIFVKNLPSDVKEKEVRSIFSKYGVVQGLEVVMWPTAPVLSPSGCLAPVELGASRSRDRLDWQGCAFVTYWSTEEATEAIRALNNSYRMRSSSGMDPLVLIPCKAGGLPDPVQISAPTLLGSVDRVMEKPAFAPGAGTLATSGGFSSAPASATASHVAEKTRCKLFVGNLRADLTKEALAAAFSLWGKVVNVHVMTGKSKFGSACAFVELSNPLEAEVALRAAHQTYDPNIGSGTAPITVTYFQSQSSGKAGQTVAAAALPRLAPY